MGDRLRDIAITIFNALRRVLLWPQCLISSAARDQLIVAELGSVAEGSALPCLLLTISRLEIYLLRHLRSLWWYREDAELGLGSDLVGASTVLWIQMGAVVFCHRQADAKCQRRSLRRKTLTYQPLERIPTSLLSSFAPLFLLSSTITLSVPAMPTRCTAGTSIATRSLCLTSRCVTSYTKGCGTNGSDSRFIMLQTDKVSVPRD